MSSISFQKAIGSLIIDSLKIHCAANLNSKYMFASQSRHPSFQPASKQNRPNLAVPRSSLFKVNPSADLLSAHQSPINASTPTPSQSRAIVFDWMTLISSKLGLSSSTLNLAFGTLDRLRAYSVDLRTCKIIGLACLQVSCKFEEVNVPPLDLLIQTSEGICDPSDIIVAERRVLTALRWKLPFNTHYTTLNWLLTQWDAFVASRGAIKWPLFKHPDPKSYERHQKTLGILNGLILDSKVQQYSINDVVCSLFYSVVCRSFDQSQRYFSDRQVSNMESAVFREQLDEFLRLTTQGCEGTHECLRFVGRYLDAPFRRGLPQICNFRGKDRLERHYEEFLSYQTHDCDTLSYVLGNL